MAQLRPFNGRIIFDHLPKTGGLAVRAWLARALGADSVAPHVAGAHQTLIRRYGGQYPIIAAHLQFVGEGLDPRYQYITCLREPLDRAVSWLFIAKNHHEQIHPLPLGLLASRFIATDGEDLHDDLLVHIENAYTAHFASISSDTARDSSQKLGLAFSAVGKYDVWGFFEDFSAFVADVAALIGLPAPNDIERVNVSPGRPKLESISPRLRKRLEELNALDIELYNMLRGQRGAARRNEPTPPDVSPWSPYNAGHSDRAYSAPEFSLISATLEEKGAVSRGEPVAFVVDFSLSVPIPNLEIGIHIFDEDGRCAFGTNTTLLNQPLLRVRPGTHRMLYSVIVDLPAGKYTAGFAAADVEGQRELAWYDKLVEFSVVTPRPQAGVGYASLSVVAGYRQTGEEIIGLVHDATGSLKIDCELKSVEVGSEFFVPVRIENASRQSWVGTDHNPLNLAYHWLDQDGKAVVFDGERTAFPATKLEPNQTLSAQVRVVAPGLPGSYRLVLTPVQERHRWFDGCATFTPGVLDLFVVDRST